MPVLPVSLDKVNVRYGGALERPPEFPLLIVGFSRMLQDEISRLFIGMQFTVQRALDAIQTRMRSGTTEALSRTIDQQREYRRIHFQTPFLDHFEKQQFPQPIDLKTIELPDSFFDEVVEGVDRSQALQFLAEARGHPVVGEAILPLLRDVLPLVDQYPTHGVDAAFDLIRTRRDDVELSFPLEEADMLFLIPFLPNDLRHTVQNLLVLHTFMRHLREEKARQPTEHAALFNDLHELARSNILLSAHWDTLMMKYGMSNENVVSLIHERVRQRELLRRITAASTIPSAQHQLGSVHKKTL